MAMRTAAISRAVRVLATADTSALCDRDLLGRYASDHDQAAFATVVNRHKAMVEGVCRRTLPNPADAEDACQAVFMLLARKAGKVYWKSSASNWLYVTARKVAQNARVASQRRAKRERRAALPEAVSPVDSLSGRELLTILDEELDKLSPRYREALVLCCLEGLARDEAASRLGVPEATLKSQLERGRKKLADALTGRGFSLGAALLAVAATCTARATSPKLAESILSAVSGSPSASVAALAQEVVMKGFLTNVKFAVLAMVGVAALGLGWATIQSTSGQPPQPEPKPALAKSDKSSDAAKAPANADPKAAETAKDQEDGAIKYSGRVLSPDGKAVAGAKLYVPHLKRIPPTSEDDIGVKCVATSGADGEFAFTYKGPSEARGFVTAYLDGFGVDGAELASDKPVIDNMVLKLVKDLPISGRIVDTEGKPVAGAAVNVSMISVPEGGKLDDYLTGWKRNWQDTFSLSTKQLLVPLDAIAGKTTTDKDGNFKLTGVGAERIAHVSIEGRGTLGSRTVILTRSGIDPKPFNEAALTQQPAQLQIKGQIPILYGPEPTFVLAAGKVVEGVVKDLTTGKPMAGISVWTSSGFGNGKFALTDANGNYRLEGLPPEKTYRVNAMPPKGSSYIRRSAQAQATPGAAPVRIDVELAKGIAVSGRVIDRLTGKGVQAGVRFAPLPDNKQIEKPGFDGYKSDRTMESTDKEGRFRVIAIPGKSVLMVQIFGREQVDGHELSPYMTARPDPDYKDLFKYEKDDNSWLFNSATGLEFLAIENVVKVMDLKEDAGEVKVELFAERGQTAKIIIQDADGKPLAGEYVAGLTAQWPNTFQLKKETPAVVYALDPERPRQLTLLHPEKKLGATVTLRGDEKAPVIVKLAALGALSGRLVETDGTPFAGATVSLSSSDRVAAELYRTVNRTAPPVKTDKDGRFTLLDAVAGVKFYLQTQKGDRYYVGEPNIGPIEIKPGQTLDIGERKLKPVN